jgi:hypothetical protein
MDEEIKPRKRRPVFLIVAIGFFGLAALTGLTFWQMKAGWGIGGDYNAALYLSAKGLNMTCPQDMGDGVRLDSVTAKRELKLIYHYSITTMTSNDTTDAIFCESYEEGIIENLDNNEDMEEFGKNNVTLVFNMRDMNGKLMCTVNLSPDKYYHPPTR